MKKTGKMLTVPETAKRLGASERTIRKWLVTGYLKGAEFVSWPGRGYWMIPESSLEGLKARPVGRPPKTRGKE
ncbi:MAG TPA: helix-turn-helix domain-containing protein [Blastocatellia bacterium]|nr:helix-turn-helix domain-containing protein [Blastocatellia bacterium]